jgi:hypothetical protein
MIGRFSPDTWHGIVAVVSLIPHGDGIFSFAVDQYVTTARVAVMIILCAVVFEF